MATSDPAQAAPLPRLARMPMVIAPDVILDLVFARGRRRTHEAAMLFDAIAADVEAGNDERPAYVAPVTVPLVHYLVGQAGASSIAVGVTRDLLRLLRVAPLANADYDEALGFSHRFAYEDAIQFLTCRRVGARYLVTGKDYEVKRTAVRRRTAGEVVAFFAMR